MPAWLAAIGSFELAHWQGQLALTLTQLPSVIVALTPYPTAAGLAKKLFAFLNLFSFLTHSNSPGTLKLPLTQSKAPLVLGSPVMGAASASGAAKGFAGLVTLLVLAFVAFVSLIVATPKANAQVITTGPSASLLELRPGLANPVEIAPGVGYQLNVAFAPEIIAGQTAYLIQASVVALGTALSIPNAGTSGALSAGLLACTLNIACLGGGVNLAGTNGGVLSGFTWKNNAFLLLSLNFPLDFGSGVSSTSVADASVPSAHKLFGLRLP